MKKALSLLMAMILCLPFTGCRDSAKQNSSAETQISAEQPSYASAKISYLGPEGTYTQEACEVFFEKQGELLPCVTVNDAVKALTDQETDYAVIPQENTIGGAVTDYLDTLIANSTVAVTGEVELPISQNLLALPGTQLSQIKTVYSHKQGIAQGKEWLEQNLPDAEVIEVSSTAEGAKRVSEEKDSSCAAIASAGCAEVYGLELLAAGIQNNDRNKTRFYVLTTKAPAQAKSDRLAFLACGSASDLPALMSAMQKQGMKLITLHDRPQKTELGQYHYLIECADSSYESYTKLTQNSGFTFRYLGSFPLR